MLISQTYLCFNYFDLFKVQILSDQFVDPFRETATYGSLLLSECE